VSLRVPSSGVHLFPHLEVEVGVLYPAHPWGAEVLCQAHPWGVGAGVAEVGVAMGVPCPDHLLAEVAGVGVVPFQVDPLADRLSGGRQGRLSVVGFLALRLLGHQGCHQLAAAERWRRRLQASKALQKQES